MKFMIGTNNSRKIEVSQKVLEDILGSTDFVLKGIDTASGVPEAPYDKEIMQGAINRVTALLKSGETDYCIGLESGLVTRYGEVYEEAWCCVASSSSSVLGYSSGLKVPDVITEKMHNDGLKHYEVMRLIKHLLPNKLEKDTWGNYSAMMLTRQVSFEEALRNALVQVFSPSDSLYHK